MRDHPAGFRNPRPDQIRRRAAAQGPHRGLPTRKTRHVHHPSSPVSAAAQTHHQTALRGIRSISRRTLAIGTVLLSSFLVVQHELPASAAALPAPESSIEGQTVMVSSAAVAADLAEEVTEERDGFDVVSYTPVQWPIDPSSTVTATFGYRVAPCDGCSTNHSGVDWTPGYGTAVHAIADGVVVSMVMDGWGSYVVIQHEIDGETVYSGYAHLVSGSNLPVGTRVSRGDVVGLVGSTGQSTAVHLHFSIIVGTRTFIDPLAWLNQHVTESWEG